MKIVCAGMRRSGSTWLYNAARLACMANGSTYACFEDRLAGAAGVEHVVIKTHKFDQALALAADKILVTVRDLRDVAASAVRRGLCRPVTYNVVQFLFKTVAEYESWESLAHCKLMYEQFVDDKETAASSVLDTLGLGTDTHDAGELIRRIEALRVPGQGADPISLLHHDHFTDGGVGTYTKTLHPGIIGSIDAVLGPWMKDRGYAVPSDVESVL